jgi:hypothetical protein
MNGRLRILWRIQRKWTAPDPELTDPKIWQRRSEAPTNLSALKRSASIFLHSEIGSRVSGKNTSTSSSPTISKYSIATAVFSYVQNKPRTERTDHTNNWNKRESSGLFYFL